MTGWVRLYDLTFIIATVISAVVFWSVNMVSPPPGLGEASTFDEGIIEQADARQDSDLEAKLPHDSKPDPDRSITVEAAS
jgi:hypothetical protein